MSVFSQVKIQIKIFSKSHGTSLVPYTHFSVVKTRSQALHQIVVEVFFRRVSSVLLFFLYCVHYFVAGFSAVVLWARTQSSFVKCLALFCGLRNRSNSCNTQI